MRPMLEQISSGEPQKIAELYRRLAEFFALTPQDTEELLPSGKQAKYHNRILWAKFHLDRAGVSEAVTGRRFLPRGVASLPA